MIKILITGADSYIGNSFEHWLKPYDDNYSVDTVSTMSDEWKNADFSQYDCVFHVAGIAHVSFDPKMEDLYFKVNRDLTVEVARHAKSAGVKQFVFMSSIIVYGNKNSVITKDTLPNPDNFYGESKLQADNLLRELQSKNFNVANIRPPMIYGKGSKGNFPRLVSLAKKTLFFPDFPNRRSMLYIDNLCEFIRWVVDENLCGVFFPQNNEYACTSSLVRQMAELSGKKIVMIKIFNPLLKLLSKKNGTFNKLFGDLVYDKAVSNYPVNERFLPFEETVRNIIKG